MAASHAWKGPLADITSIVSRGEEGDHLLPVCFFRYSMGGIPMFFLNSRQK